MHNNIPEEVISSVLERNDIVDVVGRYVQLSKQGKNFKGLCPFHSEKTPSFTVSQELQIFKCYGCGIGGNAIKFMMEIEGFPFPEAVEMLADEAGVPVTWSAAAVPTEADRHKFRLYEANELAAKFFHHILKNTNHGKSAMDYLEKRGFSNKLIDTFQIGYAPAMRDALLGVLKRKSFTEYEIEQAGLSSKREDNGEPYDRFRDRVIFPIYDYKGRIVGFSGRILGPGQPKYLNSPETVLFNKSRQLYNLHLAASDIRKSKQVVLFEGFADVIKAWDAGVHNSIATMGTALTEQHIQMLKRYAEQIVLCFDGDSAGQAAVSKSVTILEQAGMEVRIALLPERLDPDDYIGKYGAERFMYEVIGHTLTATSFKLRQAVKRDEVAGDDLKMIQEGLQIIANLPSPTEREFYLKEFAQGTTFTIDVLRQELHQIREKLEKRKTVGDNKVNTWNNVRNRNGSLERENALMPAYHNAERKLLALMMADKEVADIVQQEIGSQFNVDVHAALAAYLYAYYAEHPRLEITRFLTTLSNEKLENCASSISLMGTEDAVMPQVMHDYIGQIKKYAWRQELRSKQEDWKRAEQSGDEIKAAQILMEIIALERQSR